MKIPACMAALFHLVILIGIGSAQTIPKATLVAAWAKAHDRHADDLEAATTSDDRRAVYRQMLDEVVRTPEILALREQFSYRQAIRELVKELPDNVLAESTNAAASNPSTNQLVERSGSTQLIALASDFKKLFSANDTAVTVNLNAAALAGGLAEGRSEQYVYAAREQVRRLSGSVTFGAKLPESEITGITGLPNTETLFDAISWDVKLRVLGDRDPRATKWYPLLIGQVGDVGEMMAVLAALEPNPVDQVTVAEAGTEILGATLALAKRQIAASWQISIKTSGLHLQGTPHQNKYGWSALIDKGIGPLDWTTNLTLELANQASVENTIAGRLQSWRLASALTGSVLKNTIVEGRAIELTVAAKASVFRGSALSTLPMKDVFQLNSTISIPVDAKGRIPISFTWSNDPNNLKSEKHISGQIGFSYDFAALWALVR